MWTADVRILQKIVQIYRTFRATANFATMGDLCISMTLMKKFVPRSVCDL